MFFLSSTVVKVKRPSKCPLIYGIGIRNESFVMKNFRLLIGIIVFMVANALPGFGQGPGIASLSRNGELVTTNLWPASAATIEWASAVTGPWHDSWVGLQNVISNGDGLIRVEIPMFFRVRVSNPDPSKLTWIEPGTFIMGSPANEAERRPEENQHEVTISRGFWIGKYEVTQKEYTEIMGNNPSFFDELGDDYPVESVDWNDATQFCAELTEHKREEGRLPEGYEYRLPTEAEWEYACRAGTKTAFHYGAALVSGMANFEGRGEYVSSIGSFENTEGIYIGLPAPVGSYEPNAWGLYDMHGNVKEWCLDKFGDYPQGPITDPRGPEHGSSNVFRGGSWDEPARICRSAQREWGRGASGDGVYGFRVVLAPKI